MAMMKRLLRWMIPALALCAIAAPARAQFIGYTSPQGVTEQIANAAPCSSTATFPVSLNLGQSFHSVYWNISGGGTTPGLVTLFGSNDNVHFLQISDDGTGANGLVTGWGYYPFLEVVITGQGGSATCTVYYSGISSPPSLVPGASDSSTYHKILWANAQANASQTANLNYAPYGNTQGMIYLKSSGSFAGTGASITVESTDTDGQTQVVLTYTFNTQNNLLIPIPPTPARILVIAYSPGSATGLLNATYYFVKPGSPVKGGSQWLGVNITSATTTTITSGSGMLHAISVNTGAAGTVKIFDVAGASCSGTPASGLLATITLTATTSPSILPFDLSMPSGICIVTSAASDITALYQ